MMISVLVGLAAGASARLNHLACLADGPALRDAWGSVAAAAGLFAAALSAARSFTAFAARRAGWDDEARRRFLRADLWAHGFFLLPLSGAWGAPWSGRGWFLVSAAFLLTKALAARRAGRGAPPATPDRGLGPVFFLSGFAALVYQVCWQRALFSAFGVNMESAALVVSVFMAGLGAGALAGGALSRRFEESLPALFLACEVLTGIFGVFSLDLIHRAGSAFPAASLPATAGLFYALLGFPTLLMGATLPLLVAYLVRRTGAAGESVGVLYFFNTLGSALACFVTVDLLFLVTGLRGAVWVAAAANGAAAVLMLGFIRRARKGRP